MESKSCPSCGRPLAPNAPAGLCPACLFGAATTTGSFDPAETAIPERAELEDLFPEFAIEELLGRGGMGAVYRARQLELGRHVAIKILPRAAAADPEFTERFRREARALAALDHPNIVTLHDFGEREGLCYFVMEFVDGVDLAQRIAAKSITTEEALAIVVQLCEALEYSHGKGVVHRDIKPANILLDAHGRVKIADFGLAKLVAADERDLGLTRTNAAVGTPRYMAPEQMAHAARADHRVDIYALGVVFYELLTGEVPAGSFLPPSRRVRGLGDHFDDVVLRAMDNDPDSRFGNVSDVKTGIKSALELRRRAPGGKRQLARRFVLFRALPAAVLAGGAAGGGAWWLVHRQESAPSRPQADSASAGALRDRRNSLPRGALRPKSSVPATVAALSDLVACELGGGAGNGFGVALRRDGNVVAWGDSRYGQSEVPREARDVVALAAGCGAKGAHLLALRDDGTLVGWGDTSYGQTRPPGDLHDPVAVAAGELHSLLLEADGRVHALGHSVDGATNVPADLPPIRQIACGAGFCLALSHEGKAFAWGANRAGQGAIPEWVAAVTITAIAAGDEHALALSASGTLFAWGRNTEGQLEAPTDLAPVTAIAAGAHATAALTADGWHSWGRAHRPAPPNALALSLGHAETVWIEPRP